MIFAILEKVRMSMGRGGRTRVFVRIRIFRIRGIFRISLARLALFAITGNPAKMNMNERLPVKDERRENPENPIIP